MAPEGEGLALDSDLGIEPGKLGFELTSDGLRLGAFDDAMQPAQTVGGARVAASKEGADKIGANEVPDSRAC